MHSGQDRQQVLYIPIYNNIMYVFPSRKFIWREALLCFMCIPSNIISIAIKFGVKLNLAVLVILFTSASYQPLPSVSRSTTRCWNMSMCAVCAMVLVEGVLPLL